MAITCHVVRPQSATRYAAPRSHGMSIAIGRRAPFVTTSYPTPAPDEASVRSGSVRSA